MSNPNYPSHSSVSEVSKSYDSYMNVDNMIVQDYAGKSVRRRAPGLPAPAKVLKPQSVIPANQDDSLIIYHYNSTWPLSNRWAFSSEVINYALIRDLRQQLQFDQLRNVRRAKICDVPRDQMPDLLNRLSSVSELLEQLDIDSFSVARIARLKFRMVCLVTLSIERFELGPRHGDEIKEKIVEFDTPALQNLYLASDMIKYISLPHPSNIRHLITTDPAEQPSTSYLLDTNGFFWFSNLVKLELSEIREANFELIVAFAIRSIGGKLQELHCNLTKTEDVDANWYSDEDRALAKSLWERLICNEDRIRQFGPSIYFRGVQLEFSRQDFDLFFDRKSFADRFNSTIENGRVSPCLQVKNCRLVFQEQELPPVQWLSIYPNIRTVIVNRRVVNQTLLAFLQRLHWLVRLKLCNTFLPPEFYTNLSTLVGSNGRPMVATLNAFTVLESAWLKFGLREFSLLSSFSRLRYLHVNLVKKQEMLQLPQTSGWPVFEFKFDFRSSDGRAKDKSVFFYRWTLKKVFAMQSAREANQVGESFTYHLSIQKQHKVNPVHHGNHPFVPSVTFSSLDDFINFVNGHSLNGDSLGGHPA